MNEIWKDIPEYEITRMKLSAAQTGRKLSEKTKAKMSAAQLNNPQKSKYVEGLDKDGNVVYRFPSTAEAARNGFHSGHISACCRGELKTHRGLHWRYV